MQLSVLGRASAVLGLVALLGGLGVWYGSLGPVPALGDYPNAPQLTADAERDLGERVTVSGPVVATDPVTIRMDGVPGDATPVTITGLASQPAVGDELRVYGVVEPRQTIRALNAVTVPPWGFWYTWSISFCAGLWVLWRLIRHWRVDPVDWTLRPRDTPWIPRLYDRLRTALPVGRD